MKSILLVFGLLLNSIFISFSQGYLGVLAKDYNQNNIKGARIVKILDDGAAKHQGLKENDIITKLANDEVNNMSDLVMALKRYNWGESTTIKYLRNDSPSSMNIILGYKKNTKTYNVHKKEFDNKELWFFNDDNTIITLDEKNNPISIEKKKNDCLLDIWYIQQDYKGDEIPQCFLDLDDKLFAIHQIKEDQNQRKVNINDIVYIQTIEEKKTETAKKAEQNLNTLALKPFSISPNPNDGIFAIRTESEGIPYFDIKIIDVSGNIITQEKESPINGILTKQFDLKNISKGTYLIQLVAGNNKQTIAKKVIIK